MEEEEDLMLRFNLSQRNRDRMSPDADNVTAVESGFGFRIAKKTL
jgi:hypothetical protein